MGKEHRNNILKKIYLSTKITPFNSMKPSGRPFEMRRGRDGREVLRNIEIGDMEIEYVK